MELRCHQTVRRLRYLVPHPLALALTYATLLGGGVALLRLPWQPPSRPHAAATTLAVLIAIWIALLWRDRRLAAGRLSTAHGSARWGKPNDLLGPRGLILGQVRQPFRAPRLLRLDGEAHLLTLAPTGSGKGIGAVLPNLLDYPGSILCTDIKGEAYAVTARYRRDTLGQTVAALDPFAVTQAPPAAYNPLDLIHPTSPDAYDTARLLASLLVVPEPGHHEPFWEEEASSLLSGVVLYVAFTAPAAHRHLGTVRHLLTLGATDFAHLLDRMANTDACHGLIRRAAHRIRQKEERLLSGILASTNRHTEFLDSPHILATLKTSTLRLEDLKQWRLTLYLVLPPHHLRTHGRWLRLLTAAALRVLTLTPGRPGHRTLFLLDEFAALGRLQSVEDAITYARAYGVSLWMLTQDLSQLRDLYPRSWQTLLANIKVLQAFGTTDHFTADHLSRLTGQATVRTQSRNRTRGTTTAASAWLPNNQTSTTDQAGETGRPLLLADEVRRLPAGRQLLFVSGWEPMLTHRLDYRIQKIFLDRSDTNTLHCTP